MRRAALLGEVKAQPKQAISGRKNNCFGGEHPCRFGPRAIWYREIRLLIRCVLFSQLTTLDRVTQTRWTFCWRTSSLAPGLAGTSRFPYPTAWTSSLSIMTDISTATTTFSRLTCVLRKVFEAARGLSFLHCALLYFFELPNSSYFTSPLSCHIEIFVALSLGSHHHARV